jgi:trehalose/maltose transport system substrate-binding protein
VKKSRYLAKVSAFALATLFLLVLSCCSRPLSREPTTITFVDSQAAHDPSGLGNLASDSRLEEFTRLTGIRVKHEPLPETALDQLQAVRSQLRTPPTPEVYSIDVFWPGILSEQFTDLKPYFSTELAMMNPGIVAAYTVNGKLVAVPYTVDMGALFYNKDLLQKYGYAKPPQTFDELEKMAARIQQGERAKSQADFWGFVWPGAAAEGLTCNALEWQAAEGGGRIIEDDRTISVNNPHAIRAWQRAAHWVGWISPPSVTSYEEWDAINMFFSGKAAFLRGWASSYFLGFGGKPIDKNKFGITYLPSGNGGQAATLGGFGLAVPRSAPHNVEAVKLVQMLVQKEMQNAEYRPRDAVGTNFVSPDIRKDTVYRGVVSRPSAVAGPKYEEIDQAYLGAVHSVLTGQTKASDAAAALEKELVRITGFKVGPPSPVQNSLYESAKANEISAPAPAHTVNVMFNVTVPATTDATGFSVHIAGTLDGLSGNLPVWNPGGMVLARTDATHWTITLSGQEGVQLQYKYALGSWDYVEKDGACGEITNRMLILTYDATGTQTVNDTVANWRNFGPCRN